MLISLSIAHYNTNILKYNTYDIGAKYIYLFINWHNKKETSL